MDKKAQLSFETIIIYGLIIVVVTLAVGALIYFGVLDLGRMLPEKCQTGAPTVCETYQIVAAGPNEVKLEIRNKVGKRITFTDGTAIQGSDDWIGTDCSLVLVNDEAVANNVTIGIDTTALLEFNCDGIEEGTETQRYKGTVTLEYKAVGSQLAQRTSGQLFAAIS